MFISFLTEFLRKDVEERLHLIVIKGCVYYLLQEEYQKLCEFVYGVYRDLAFPLDGELRDILAVTFDHHFLKRMKVVEVFA